MKINFFAPINQLGFGIHAYNLIAAFEKRGHTVALIPPSGQVAFRDDAVERWLAARKTVDISRPGIMIYHEQFMTQFAGSPRIGFPVFELERFDPEQLAAMKTCDYLLQPSQWGADVLRENGLANKVRRNIFVVNEGYDPAIFPFYKKSTSETEGLPFTFLHVGKFEERKGTLQAVECFYRALERETARLILHIHNPFNPDCSKIHSLLRRLGFMNTLNADSVWRKAGLSVLFMNPFRFQADMSMIYEAADCGLYPSRAEGWGLPILETLVSGAPCIVGNWTGQSEYLKNSYPGYMIQKIAGADHVLARDDMWFDGSRGNWWKVRDDFLIGRIRDAFLDARKLRAGDYWQGWVSEIRTKFTWARAAEQLEKVMEEILG